VAPHLFGRQSDMVRSVALKVVAGDLALAAGHRPLALPPRFHLSLCSRCSAMLAVLRTLIQTRHGPDR
jgi:hypothetical protein